jgi:type IV pilus assembly protein PilC
MSRHDPPRSSKRFSWQGTDHHGRTLQGQLNATSIDLAKALLRRQGLQEVQVQRLWWDNSPKVRLKDLAPMTRQLAALLKAGVPLLQALNMLTRSLPSEALAEVMGAVQSDVEAGLSLHAALAQHPGHFSGLYISMVQAGESAGILDTMMERLAGTLEKNEALRSRVRSALVYPCAVMVVALAVLVLILVFVVPVFQDVFKSFGADLPWATQWVVALSEGLSASWPWVLLVGLGATWFWQRDATAHADLKIWLQRWLLKWPLLGPLIRTSVVARWTQTLSALLAAGVPLAEALGPVAQACDHVVFARVTYQLQRRVAQGSSLSEAMTLTNRFPAMIVQLCATGEETGSMDNLLARAGALMETELDDQINALSSLLEPLIILVLGGMIGGILVAMYLPIFRLGQVF